MGRLCPLPAIAGRDEVKCRCLTSWIERTQARMLRAARRRRGVFCFDGYSSCPRASLAEDPVAALADAADAETAHAGFLGRRGDTIVMHREPAFSEFHLEVLCSAGSVKTTERYRRRVKAPAGDCVKCDGTSTRHGEQHHPPPR
jgi:hypothetical protein